jgi:hypothetical protein
MGCRLRFPSGLAGDGTAQKGAVVVEGDALFLAGAEQGDTGERLGAR